MHVSHLYTIVAINNTKLAKDTNSPQAMLKYPTKNAANAPKFDKDLRLSPLYAMRNAMEVPKIFSLGQKGVISYAIIRAYTFNNYSSHVCDASVLLSPKNIPKDPFCRWILSVF